METVGWRLGVKCWLLVGLGYFAIWLIGWIGWLVGWLDGLLVACLIDQCSSVVDGDW